MGIISQRERKEKEQSEMGKDREKMWKWAERRGVNRTHEETEVEKVRRKRQGKVCGKWMDTHCLEGLELLVLDLK